MNLKANALPIQQKSLEIDKAPKLNASKKGSQPTEFNNIFGQSVTELTKSQALGQAVAHQCTSGECNPLIGQSLPQSGENLPILGEFNAPIDIPVLVDEVINPLNTEALISIAPGIVQEEVASTISNEGLPIDHAESKRVSLLESVAVPELASPLVHSSEAESLPINFILADSSVANSVIESVSGKKLNTNIDARNALNHSSVSSAPIVLQPQGQGAGQQGNMDNLGQQNLSLTEMPIAQAESKVDFSQFLEKVPSVASKDGTAIESALLASKSSVSGAPKLAAAATETFQLHQPINKPGWSAELGSRLVWLSKEGVQEAKIRLTPANLGTIDIKITVENDQAKVSFLSQHSAVRDIIEGSLPRLREMMMDAGVKLEHANVGSQSNGSERQNQSHLENEDKETRFSAEQQELVEQGGHELLIETEDSVLKGVDYYA